MIVFFRDPHFYGWLMGWFYCEVDHLTIGFCNQKSFFQGKQAGQILWKLFVCWILLFPVVSITANEKEYRKVQSESSKNILKL